MEDIPISLEEAARIDGCSLLQTLFRISIPLATPGIASTAILSFIFSWNEFLFALLLTRQKVQTAPIRVLNFIVFEKMNWGVIAAGAIVIALPVYFWYCHSKILRQGPHTGRACRRLTRGKRFPISDSHRGTWSELFAALALLSWYGACDHSGGIYMKQPNVVFIISDDQGFWSLGCAGNREIYTPNIDRLAAQGMRFENFFCASAGMLTGESFAADRVYPVSTVCMTGCGMTTNVEHPSNIGGSIFLYQSSGRKWLRMCIERQVAYGSQRPGPAGLYALVLPQIRRRALLWGAPVPGWCIISGRALCHRCYHR